MLEDLQPQIVSYGVRAGGALLLLFVAWLIAGWASRALRKSLRKARVDVTLTRFLARITRSLILLFAVLSCLGIFGVETTSFAAVLAAAGFAIGLAFQSTLSNFSAGVMLLVFRPYKVGDVISVSGETGTVEEIALFTTMLDTPDNRRVIVPNASVFGSKIENITFHPTRRVEVAIKTDSSADLERTREVLLGAAEAVEGHLHENTPSVYLSELRSSSMDWSVSLWCKTSDYCLVRERLIIAIKKALDEAGIAIK